MRQQELPPLRNLGSADKKGELEGGPPASTNNEEMHDVTPAAVQQLLDAVKVALTEQLDELRAALPAAIAEAVWSYRQSHATQPSTKPTSQKMAPHTNIQEDRLMNQRTMNTEGLPGAAPDSNNSLPQLTEAPTTSEDFRRQEWLSEINGVLSNGCRTFQQSEQLNFLPSSMPNKLVRRAGSIGGLKSQIADQLLRQHALIPQQLAPQCSSKVADEAEVSASICSLHDRSPDVSPTSSQCGHLGTFSNLRRTPAAISTGSSSKRPVASQPTSAGVAPDGKQQDSLGQVETSDCLTSRSQGIDPASPVSPGIKAFVSTLDPRCVGSSNQVEELRQRRVSELTNQVKRGTSTISEDSSPLQRSQSSSRALQYQATLVLPGRWLLLVFGVLPLRHFLKFPLRQSRWGSLARCYQPFVCCVVAVACFEVIASSLKLDVSQSSQDIEDEVQLELLSDLALAVSSLVGLLLLGVPFGSRALCECFPLLFLTGNEASHLKLSKRMLREFVGLIFIWLAALLSRLYGSLLLSEVEQVTWSVPHYFSFVVISGVLISLALTMLSVCHSLAIMVDTFCVKVSEILTCSGDLTVAVKEWNVLQAVLRKASKTIELCFFALQTGAFAVVILLFFDFTRGLVIQIVPGALVFLGLTRIFYCAAAITDKCADVPSLINSLHFGEDLDVHRQYTVQYIMQSAAGFYVFGVPLNSAVTLKLAYFCVIATLGLMHRVLSSGW